MYLLTKYFGGEYMRKSLILVSLISILIASLCIPLNSVEAATKVKTTVHNYKGQQYIQLSGGNKTITAKINKTLKNHAVIAAKWDSENKKDSKDYYHKTTVKTMYNDNGKISIVHIDSSYTGGVHGLYFSTTYNYDLNTGKRIKLGDVVNTEDKVYNLFIAVSNDLLAKSKKGRAIFEENIYDIPLDANSKFYFYKNGIVIRFDPYDVAPFSDGFVDVFVNNLTLNKPVNITIPEPVIPQPVVPSYDVIESQINDDFEGYDEGNLYELSNGQIWKQVDYKYSYRYSYRPEVIIYREGSRYYMHVEDMDDAVEVVRIK